MLPGDVRLRGSSRNLSGETTDFDRLETHEKFDNGDGENTQR